MSFLIDTDIIIYSIKGDPAVQKNFKRNEKYPLSISAITYGELLFGARKSSQVEKNLAIVFRIRELFPVINIDKPVVETFSELKATGQKTGSIVDDLDLLIASTALTHNLTLVSNNTKHFQKIKGLKLENWTRS